MFKLLAKLIKIVLIAAGLLVASIFAYERGWLKQHPFSKQLEQLEIKQVSDLKNVWQGQFNSEATKSNLSNLSEDAGEKIKDLSQKALEAGEITQSFVKEAVKVDEENEKNISEKAFEYGRYVYCQQVVKDWDQEHAATTSAESDNSAATEAAAN